MKKKIRSYIPIKSIGYVLDEISPFKAIVDKEWAEMQELIIKTKHLREAQREAIKL